MYWADLQPNNAACTGECGVYYGIDDGSASSYCPGTTSWCNSPAWMHVVVAYESMNYWNTFNREETTTFEAILFGDGAFLLQYKTMDPVHLSWSTESIGWEDQSGRFGTQVQRRPNTQYRSAVSP